MTSGDYFATRTTLPKSFMSSRRLCESGAPSISLLRLAWEHGYALLQRDHAANKRRSAQFEGNWPTRSRSE